MSGATSMERIMNAKSRGLTGFIAGTLAALALALFLSACSRSDPQAALNVAAGELQAALEARDANKALDLLHQDFVVESSVENGREWARKTMTLAFMRYKNVKIVALNQENRIDANLPDRAISTGDIALVGAEGMIPDNARRYRVQLGWIREGDQWKLLRLKWE
jgi:ketosteroid isomerase-like protein